MKLPGVISFRKLSPCLRATRGRSCRSELRGLVRIDAEDLGEQGESASVGDARIKIEQR
jgi:hypothetical protein